MNTKDDLQRRYKRNEMTYRSLFYEEALKEKPKDNLTHLEEKSLEIAKNYSDFKGGYKDFQKELLIFAEEYHEYKVSNFIL